ncbi:ATP-binding protein [Nitrosomonas halophila]|uniref:histidine kinase n=1 Tax=Nitrosomonas halophila TaxID=44576 RepID=A0A1H3NV55_9PROT|nr:ATP-binding protein [Nitrosomonas halophila]SDY92620.1 two-component system, OmpR family, sensor histidine kinase PhoQ [Nitrosomonas halophila]
MMSLNQRILASASIVLLLFVGGTAFTLDHAFHDNALAALQDRMLGKLYLLMGSTEVDSAGNLSMPAELPGLPELNQPNSGTYAYITNGAQTIAWQSASILHLIPPLATRPAIDHKNFERLVLNQTPYFIFSFETEWETQTINHPFTFHVVMDSTLFDSQIDRYQKNLWSWLAIIAILLLTTQAFALHWGLRPMRKVSRELNNIEMGVQDSLHGIYPIELRRLTDNINSLLNHERKHQQRYRNALADLAHSLKTPLAILQGALRTEADAKKLQLLLAEQVQRMDHIVQYQLRRAAAVGQSPGSRLIPLRPVVEKIIKAVSRAHYSKQPQTTIKIDPALQVRIDAGDLMELLGNLIDNAFKWCQNAVCISAYNANNQTIISIEDDGPGIPQDEIARILERGERADPSVPGHGIGLAIVQDILQANGGQLSIRPMQPTGSSVTVHFAAAATP